MIDKIRTDYQCNSETFEVSCDGCDEIKEFDVSGWDELMREMKSENWISKKVGQDWEHYCWRCTEKSRVP